MKWIEQIKVQIPMDQIDSVNHVLNDIEANFDGAEGQCQVNVFRNVKLSTEFIISLDWDVYNSNGVGSKEGNSIKQLLSKYGMVHHSIWQKI